MDSFEKNAKNLHFFHEIGQNCSKIGRKLADSGVIYARNDLLRELFAPNVQCIKGICAICTVFEEVFLGLGQLLAGLVFVEAVASIEYSGRLNGEDKIIVILTIEKRHETLLALEGLVDEQVLLIVAHGVAQIDILDLPAVTFKLVNDYPPKILCINGIVASERGCIVVENDRFVTMFRIVIAEVIDERRKLSFKLDVEGFQHI